MKKLKFLFSLLLFSAFFGCNSIDDNETEVANPLDDSVLIFGWFADSSCSGDCSDIYKIEKEKIYKNVDNNYPENTFFDGNFQIMANVEYEDYKVLLTEFPNEIINKSNGYLDCTDCTNANGGFYIELQNDDIHKSWRFRNGTYPDYMDNYRSILLNKLADLNSL